jgi:simple sugar transport system permease protein
MAALLISGGLAGLGGTNYVQGSPGYFEQNFAPYQGYLGIAVALLARNHPLAIPPAAFAFAVLAEGGQAIQQFVPKEIGEILQAMVILFVVVGAKWSQRVELRPEAGRV